MPLHDALAVRLIVEAMTSASAERRAAASLLALALRNVETLDDVLPFVKAHTTSEEFAAAEQLSTEFEIGRWERSADA